VNNHQGKEHHINVGIFGSGRVGQAIVGKVAELGHAVMLGTCAAAKLQDWLGKAAASRWLRLWGALGTELFNVKIVK
jgi:hypothetical protein